MSDKEELVYTSDGFEAFLQQAEITGISKKRQRELMVQFLAKDVTLEDLVKENIANIVNWLGRNIKKTVIVLVLFSVVGFYVHSEYNARKGYTDYQPWQFEVAAVLKQFQNKALSVFDWTTLFYADCIIMNPVLFLYNAEADQHDGINCTDRAILDVDKAIDFEGTLGTGVQPPFVIEEAGSKWKFNSNSTLEDIHQWLLDNKANYPCSEFDSTSPISTFDPLGDLIAGKLKEGENAAAAFSMVGCSKLSNRLLRSMITERPVFMDATIESTKPMIAIAYKHVSGAKVQDYKLSREGEQMWVAQIIGDSELKISDSLCPNVTIKHDLKPGSFVVLGEHNVATFVRQEHKDNFIIIQTF